MNKSKKELYEENKKLRQMKKTYSYFWETDAIEECTKQHKFARITIYLISIGLLIAGAFFIGLSM